MFIISIFIDIYPAYVDDIDTSRINVDIFNKYKHMAARRTWYKGVALVHRAAPLKIYVSLRVGEIL